MGKGKRRGAILALMTVMMLLALYITAPVAEANVPNIRMGTLQVDDYYDTLRDAFYQADYYSAGACNGWVLSVINNSGLVPEITVDGTTVLELNDALKNNECFDLVATREGGQSDYQEATDQMQQDVNDGKIRAGDIVIFTKNMDNYEGTGGPHWLHAAIVMKELFNGTADNYENYWEGRWRESYKGFPTIAHALAPDYGVEYYSPMCSPSSLEAADDGSTGYYVYRINTEKAAEAFEKATATEATTENTSEKTTAASADPSKATEGTTAAQKKGDYEEELTGSAQAVSTTASSGSGSTGTFGRVLAVLATLISVILIFLCILIL